MRRLILLRHAKSDRPAGVADRERPLNARGRRTAPAVGAHLAKEGFRPDLAFVSTALRTRETWDAMAAALGNPETRWQPEIYEAPARRILDVIKTAPDTAITASATSRQTWRGRGRRPPATVWPWSSRPPPTR
jgi:phosphohistidine phosphatase